LQPCRLLPTPYLEILQKFLPRKCFNNSCLQKGRSCAHVLH
jgi:hypothetical protein